MNVADHIEKARQGDWEDPDQFISSHLDLKKSLVEFGDEAIEVYDNLLDGEYEDALDIFEKLYSASGFSGADRILEFERKSAEYVEDYLDEQFRGVN